MAVLDLTAEELREAIAASEARGDEKQSAALARDTLPLHKEEAPPATWSRWTRRASQLIRERRRLAGLHAKDVAEKLGVSRSLISQWETGRKPVPQTRWRELVEAVGMELDELLAVVGEFERWYGQPWKGGWIPIEQEMPGDGQLCALVSNDAWPGRSIAVARYREDHPEPWDGQEVGYYRYVTHWLPLPEPPENR